MRTLRVILNDQLNENISSLKDCNKDVDIVFMAEVKEEYTYVNHHKKKIVFLISAMRHFKEQLINNNYNVSYTEITDACNTGSITSEVIRIITDVKSIRKIVITHPGEYRILKYIRNWKTSLKIPVEILPDSRFLSTTKEFQEFFGNHKKLCMEYFYRYMRKKYSILLKQNRPIGGKWNYDFKNRKFPEKKLKIYGKHKIDIDSITKKVIFSVEKLFFNHFGDIQPFSLAVTRIQALKILYKFSEEKLKYFGEYQDAMIQGEPYMYHAHISLYLNCGLLLPLECIRIAENSYHNAKVPISAVEGFIRQILGWREYIRSIYWLKMPEYYDLNFFETNKNLPSFYWTANTKMNCLHECILETKTNAYAHHIQRLMLLGNFALIAGIDPKQVNQWFLTVYIDAYEWVELPNVTGLALFADGGLVATKPYAASGNYIRKMSNYCKKCQYKVDKKNGSEACPFNYLYWNFLAVNREKIETNPRMTMMYRKYDKMSDDRKKAIKNDSESFLF